MISHCVSSMDLNRIVTILKKVSKYDPVANVLLWMKYNEDPTKSPEIVVEYQSMPMQFRAKMTVFAQVNEDATNRAESPQDFAPEVNQVELPAGIFTNMAMRAVASSYNDVEIGWEITNKSLLGRDGSLAVGQLRMSAHQQIGTMSALYKSFVTEVDCVVTPRSPTHTFFPKEQHNYVEFGVSSLAAHRAIMGAAFAASRDEGRRNICGVMLELSKADEESGDDGDVVVKATSTNGHRLFHSRNVLVNLTGKKVEIPLKCEFIVPVESLSSLSAMLNTASSKFLRLVLRFVPNVAMSEMEVDLGDGFIELRVFGINLQYPDWERVVPKNLVPIFTVDKKELLEALDAATENIPTLRRSSPFGKVSSVISRKKRSKRSSSSYSYGDGIYLSAVQNGEGKFSMKVESPASRHKNAATRSEVVIGASTADPEAAQLLLNAEYLRDAIVNSLNGELTFYEAHVDPSGTLTRAAYSRNNAIVVATGHVNDRDNHFNLIMPVRIVTDDER